MASLFYDRDGKPIEDTLEWARKFEDRAYQRVARTVLGDGRVVSTVWLGVDQSFGQASEPLIFETMAFASEETMDTLLCFRWPTLGSAIAGHDQVVAGLRDEWNVEQIAEAMAHPRDV